MNRTLFTKLGFVRTALAVGVGIPFLIASASAQDATPAPESAATAERIIVTGSYIPTAETESALPVTVYTAETITKLGAQTPAEGLRQLPSFVGNTLTENDSNGGDGTALINLRALGAGNTLTLINGRRTFAFVDINLIGLGSLSRTEILKDGASSIYGSDAVAGVVNFILLDGPNEAPYEGAEVYGLYGNTTDTDAHVWQFYLRGGVTGLDGKLSIAAAGEYYSRANLFSRDRLISSTGDVSNDATGLQLGGFNNNSPTFAGRVAVNGAQMVLIDSTNNAPTPASYRPFDVIPGSDPSRFNFRAFSPAIPAQERFDYYATANYKVFGDGLQVYGDVLYSHLTQDNGLAAAPFAITNGFNGLTEVQQSPFNPFLNAGPKDNGNPDNPNLTGAGSSVTQLRYRLVNDLGPRRSFFDKDAWRYVAAVKGDFNFQDNAFISHFGYDSGFVYERFNEVETDSGDATRTGIVGAIASGQFNPFIGQGAPASGIAPIYDGNGVQIGTAPYDNATAGANASYIGTTQFLERSFLVDAKVNAHLFPNLYNGGIDIAAGYEHRQDRNETVPENVQLAGDQLGFNAATALRTTQEVDSFFAELSVPLVTSTMNIPGIKSFEIGLAWRHEEFELTDNLLKRSSSFSNSNKDEDFGGSPRIAIRYQPITDLTLRATASQSFQAPGPGQLFSTVSQNFPNLFDPIKGLTLQPPNGVFQGGNTALLPETTDEYTAGVVYSPSFVRGLTITADYYNLFTTNLILDPSSAAQLLLTLDQPDPDGPGAGAGFPGFPGGPATGVTRFSNGDLSSIDSVFSNAGRRNVQGIDITAQYSIPTQNLGTFTVSSGLNHFFTYKIEAIQGLGYTDFLGNYNNGSLPLAPGAIPFNKAFLRGEWEFKNFDFVATGNYIGDYEDDPAFILNRGTTFQDLVPGNPGTDANPNYILHRRVTSYITLDMGLSYTFPKPAPVEAAPAPGYSKDAKDGKAMAEHTSMSTADTSASIWQRLLWDTTLTVGVNNAFDRTPPTVLGAFNDNYDTSLYSIRNRYYYISLKKKF